MFIDLTYTTFHGPDSARPGLINSSQIVTIGQHREALGGERYRLSAHLTLTAGPVLVAELGEFHDGEAASRMWSAFSDGLRRDHARPASPEPHESRTPPEAP